MTYAMRPSYNGDRIPRAIDGAEASRRVAWAKFHEELDHAQRLQVVNASKISARAQIIKLADKISNVRAILTSPPADWSLERQREYLEWATKVVNNLSVANPVLKADFDATSSMFSLPRESSEKVDNRG